MNLAVHMLVHCALVAVVAPLIVLMRPVNRVLEVSTPETRRRIEEALRWRPAALITAPPVAWLLFVGSQVAFHVSGLYDSSKVDPTVDGIAHLVYALTALLFWEVAIGSSPLPRRLTGLAPALYLMAAMPAVDLSAAWLMVKGEPLAGAAMVAGMAPIGLAAAISAWRYARAEEARAGLEGTA
ncbi:MAG TPA: cytochrome c oxidase assembly protein [Solirubrobacterales bacterium]|nr:cytochrome c oxidase assembly protein [Solirubrobacterales bacterium]